MGLLEFLKCATCSVVCEIWGCCDVREASARGLACCKASDWQLFLIGIYTVPQQKQIDACH